MNAISFGVIFVIVTVILCVCIFKFANKDKKVNTQYDERQKAVRGKAYMYAFYTELIVQTVIIWIFMTDIELPIEDYALVFLGLILGAEVLCGYCIWHDVYWGLNNDHRRYHIIFIAAIFINAFDVVIAAANGLIMQNGKIGMYMLNISALVMLLAIYVEMLIKRIVDKKSGTEED